MAVKRFAQPAEKDPELGSTDGILGIFDIDHYMKTREDIYAYTHANALRKYRQL